MSAVRSESQTPSARRERVHVGATVLCPDLDCNVVAQIVDTWVWPSTDGPVPHAQTRCRLGQVFTPPSDWLVPVEA